MSEILQYLIGALGGMGLTVFVVLYLIMNPEKFDKWVSIILRAFRFMGVKVKKEQVKREIQGSINSYTRGLATELGSNTVDMKIKWAGGEEDDDIRWADGSVVLVLRDRGHRQRNFVHAAYLFTSTTLLKDAKALLSKKQATALDLFTTGRIIEKEDKPALDIYTKDILNPLLQDEKIKAMVEEFEDIHTAGYYYNVLLQELDKLSGIAILKQNKGEVYQEVNNLIDFLNRFAHREVGDNNVSDEFVGKFLHCSIKIVSTAQVRATGKIKGPSERVCKAFDKGIESVYVIGPGHAEGIQFINRVCEAVCEKKPGLELTKGKQFQGIINMNGKTTTTTTYMAKFQNPAQKRLFATTDTYRSISEYADEAITTED